MRENEDLWTKIKKLEHRVESGDGSLFDLRRDSIEEIVNTIAGTVPLGKIRKPAESDDQKAVRAQDCREDQNSEGGMTAMDSRTTTSKHPVGVTELWA